MLPEWEAFLRDQEVSDANTSPRGQYLYGKILHDLLQYLNAHRACIQLIFDAYGEQAVPKISLEWIRSNKLVFEQMVERVDEFWKFHRNVEGYDDKWPELIEQVGAQVDQLPELISELKQLPLPHDVDAKSWVEASLRSLERANRLRLAIRHQEYKKLYLTKHW